MRQRQTGLALLALLLEQVGLPHRVHHSSLHGRQGYAKGLLVLQKHLSQESNSQGCVACMSGCGFSRPAPSTKGPTSLFTWEFFPTNPERSPARSRDAHEQLPYFCLSGSRSYQVVPCIPCTSLKNSVGVSLRPGHGSTASCTSCCARPGTETSVQA